MQNWLKYGHINSDVLTRLNRQFDVLIPAWDISNKQAERAAGTVMRREFTDLHSGLTDEKAGEDDDDRDAPAMPRTPAQRNAAAPVAVDRVAVRAPTFDLRYLMDRMETAR